MLVSIQRNIENASAKIGTVQNDACMIPTPFIKSLRDNGTLHVKQKVRSSSKIAENAPQRQVEGCCAKS